MHTHKDEQDGTEGTGWDWMQHSLGIYWGGVGQVRELVDVVLQQHTAAQINTASVFVLVRSSGRRCAVCKAYDNEGTHHLLYT